MSLSKKDIELLEWIEKNGNPTVIDNEESYYEFLIGENQFQFLFIIPENIEIGDLEKPLFEYDKDEFSVRINDIKKPHSFNDGSLLITLINPSYQEYIYWYEDERFKDQPWATVKNYTKGMRLDQVCQAIRFCGKLSKFNAFW
jgi:hypothetical protein